MSNFKYLKNYICLLNRRTWERNYKKLEKYIMQNLIGIHNTSKEVSIKIQISNQ